MPKGQASTLTIHVGHRHTRRFIDNPFAAQTRKSFQSTRLSNWGPDSITDLLASARWLAL